MAEKDPLKGAKTESGFSVKDAEEAGWVFDYREARVAEAEGSGGKATLTMEDSVYWAEKTVDDTTWREGPVATPERLLDAIESRETSHANAAPTAPVTPVLNDAAGDAGKGEENVGIAGVLPETKVDRENLAKTENERMRGKAA